VSIICGECLEVMKTFPDNHFSAIVTDPPYGLHFMGKDWDKFKKTNFDERGDYNAAIENGKERMVRKIATGNAHSGTYDPKRDDEFQSFIRNWAVETLRITKPGGHVLMFGAPRRYHRQVCGLEDAGWEIRDCLMWIFGSGFPKSHNNFGIEGFGTALKPAYEPIIMAMKPCEGTFKQNAEKWGQAGININGCRIGNSRLPTNPDPNKFKKWKEGDGILRSPSNNPDLITTKGRWPANIMFDEEAAALLDEQSGVFKSGSIEFHHKFKKEANCFGKYQSRTGISQKGDSGGASRFFYCAKASHLVFLQS